MWRKVKNFIEVQSFALGKSDWYIKIYLSREGTTVIFLGTISINYPIKLCNAFTALDLALVLVNNV